MVVSLIAAGEPFELRHGDRPQIESPLGVTAEPHDRESEPVLARVVVLLHQAALLERGEQTRCGGLVESEAPGEFRYACLPLRLPQSDQE